MGSSVAISVIIVNFNGLLHLKECLDSLMAQTFRDFEIIVVDNASSDGSADFVRGAYSDVKVVVNDRNLGYGGGNNEGIRIAGGKYIVLLNNDTKADPEWLATLFKAADKDPGVGMCASKILNYYRPDIIDNTGLLMYRDGVARGRGRLEEDAGQYDSEEEVFFPSGCAGLYRRAMLDEIGLLDEDFFLYVEDVDIGLRGRLAGWKCVYVPGAVVYHKYSATTEPYSPLKAYLVERNRIWVMMKCFPLRMLAKSPCHTLLRYLTQGYGIITGRGAGSRIVRSHSVWEGVKILVRSYASAFRGCGKILAKRRQVRRLTKVSAGDISGWFRRFGISAREVALKE